MVSYSRRGERICINLFLITLTIGGLSIAGAQQQAATSQTLSISAVSVSKKSFNPSQGDTVELRYTLSINGDVTIHVFDPDFKLIRALAESSPVEAGENVVIWDGKDGANGVVPNEAYFFTIEAKRGSDEAVYDPVTFSGGEPFDISKGQFSRESGTLTYKLSQPSRALSTFF